MKKSLLILTLLLATYFAFGQCGPYTITNIITSCTSDTLRIPGASAAAKIIWLKNGIPFDSVYAKPIGPVTTVAGGVGQAGSGLYELIYPTGVCKDSAGNVYVLDYGESSVMKYPPGSTSATIGTIVAGGNGQGSAANQLYAPYGICMDSAANIYVCDQANNRIQKFPRGSTSATNAITVAGGNGSGTVANQLHSPTSVCIDRAGNLYIVDGGNNRVQKFPAGSTSATNATTVAGGNGTGSAANQLYAPYGACVDRQGYIYVTEWVNHRVQKFPPGSTSATNGTTVAGGNGSGNAGNQLSSPMSIYVDSTGYLYVVDGSNDRILKFPPNSTSATSGTVVAGGNGHGAAADQFEGPMDISVDDSNNIYVADYSNSRIQKWSQPAILGNIDTSLIVTAAGIYSAMVTDTSGCVALSGTITVSINTTDSIHRDICQGSTYTFNGMNLSASGTYFDTLTSVNGCDSFITLTLTVYTVTNISLSHSICQGSVYSFGGHNLSVPGVYYDTLLSSPGCDSIITTLTLTVYPVTTTSLSQTICHGSTYHFGGYNLSMPGTYTDTLASYLGCDSIIITLTLTVYTNPGSTISQGICQGDSYTFNGHSLTTAGMYYDTLAGIYGCDSIVTLTLSSYQSSDTTITQAICPGSRYALGANTYTASGIYIDTLAGASIHGCDSIVTLELFVLDSATSYFYLQPSDSPHVWFIILPDAGANITYLWSWGDSTSSIGDTVSHTYGAAGYYNICLTVTDSGGCSATYCDTSVYLYKNQAGQMVYVQVLKEAPNSINTISSDHLNINYYGDAIHFSEVMKAPTDLTLYDLSGRVVMRQSDFSGSIWPVNNDIAQGVYIIHAQSDGAVVSKKLVITR